MKYLIQKFLPVFFGSLFFLAACNQQPDDQQIKDNIDAQLKKDSGNNDISATVADGVVTLTGTCEGANCAETTEEEIRKIEGVKSVNNNIQTQQQTDLTLRTSVQSIISKYEGVQADVAGGVIVLRGSINRDQVQPLMNELQPLNAKKIDNQLAVQ